MNENIFWVPYFYGMESFKIDNGKRFASRDPFIRMQGTTRLVEPNQVGTLAIAEGIRCYQCGTYIITSVTPCRNLSAGHLADCPSDAQFCSKYSNPAIQVYGCEKSCEERVQNSFEIHCCSEDKCNGGESIRGPGVSWVMLLSLPVTWLLAL